MEAMIGASRRVPRVVEAPQEALQLQRQDAMRDAEMMATQVPFKTPFWEADCKWWMKDFPGPRCLGFEW